MAEYIENETFKCILFIQAMWEKTKKEYIENGTIVPNLFILAKNKAEEGNLVYHTELPFTKHLDGVKLIAEKFKVQFIIQKTIEDLKEHDIEFSASFQSDIIIDDEGNDKIIIVSKIGDGEDYVRTFNVVHNRMEICDFGKIISEVDFMECDDE